MIIQTLVLSNGQAASLCVEPELASSLFDPLKAETQKRWKSWQSWENSGERQGDRARDAGSSPTRFPSDSDAQNIIAVGSYLHVH